MARSMKNTQAEAQIDTTATQSVDWGKWQHHAARSIMKRLHGRNMSLVLTDEDGVVRVLNARDLVSLGKTLSITSARYRDYEAGTLSGEDYTTKTNESVGYFLTSDDYSNAL